MTIVYSESSGDKKYEVRSIPPLDSYNQWLGRHGILIRNYCEEWHALVEEAEKATSSFHRQALLATISDILSDPVGTTVPALTPRSNLLTLAEWVSNAAIPQRLALSTSVPPRQLRGCLETKPL